ncbi:MAG: fibronectin type III domain-containing protein, partial [Acidimicrobiales bacterium]
MLKLPLAVLAVLVGLLGLTPAVDAVSPVEQVTSSAPRPRNLTVTAQSTSSISINWQTGFGAETSPNGFIVSIRRTHPAPVEPIGTPKCPELWRSWRTPRATQFPTECVIDGLQPGAYYEIQVMESPNGENSAPATAWSGTFVPGVENLQVEVDWKADGSDIVATWKLPTDMKNIDSSYARFFTADNRMVWSCYRNVAQTGRCKFSEVVDGDYRVEVRTTGGYGSEPISKKVTVERPIQDAKDLEPSYYWHSDIPGQMFLNLSWTHIAATGTNSYTASATGRTCTALASATPERL